MKIVNLTKFPKWQQRLLLNAINDSYDYILKAYPDVSKEVLSLIYIKASNTCRFSNFNTNNNRIRLKLKQPSKVYLYEKKSIGQYNNIINTIEHHAYASCLIHEIIHYIQKIQNRKYSEIETTLNEINYLKSKGYNITINKNIK